MRKSSDDYFMGIALEVTTRATCDRKHVGAVIVRDKCILATGYNGSIRGQPHCDDDGHLMEDGHCCRTVHAEANAIIQAARNGVRIDKATIYTTASPCWPCFMLIANAGIVRIVFGEAYRAEDSGPKRVIQVAKSAGIELVALSTTTVLSTGGREVAISHSTGIEVSVTPDGSLVVSRPSIVPSIRVTESLSEDVQLALACTGANRQKKLQETLEVVEYDRACDHLDDSSSYDADMLALKSALKEYL